MQVEFLLQTPEDRRDFDVGIYRVSMGGMRQGEVPRSGHLERFDWIGYVMTVTTGVTIILMYAIDRYIRSRVTTGQAA